MAEPKEIIIQEDTGSGWEVVEIEGKQFARRVKKSLTLSDIDIKLKAAQIPRLYIDKEFANFQKVHHVVDASRSFVSNFAKSFPAVEKGLLLYGPPGSGKTHLAIAALKEAIRETGARGLFVDYREFIRQIQDSFNRESATSSRDIVKPVLEAELLVMDELGALKPTEWVLDTITYIINNRYTENKITIFTTNFEVDNSKIEARQRERDQYLTNKRKEFQATLSAGQAAKAIAQLEFGHLSERDTETLLEDKIGFRLMSRLHEMCDFIPFDGAPDYRKR